MKMKIFTMVFMIGIVSIALTENLIADANPYLDRKIVSPPINPVITVLSPENNTVIGLNLKLSFNALIDNKSVSARITHVYYRTSWQADNFTLYSWSDHDPLNRYDDDPFINEYSRELTIVGIPEGKQTVTLVVTASGSYSQNGILYSFGAGALETVNFVVDIAAPVVSVLTLENKTYAESEISLNAIINEPVSKLSYVLDGQENVTFAENTTLTGLSSGLHNVTVFAWDLAGNVGASETVTFTIDKPEPTMLSSTPVLASAASAAVVVTSIGIVLYLRNRENEGSTKAGAQGLQDG